ACLACEVQEVVGLMRADVGDNAAVPLALEEPPRPMLDVQSVRSESHGLQDASDDARFDQLSGLDHAAVARALAVIDQVQPTGLTLNASGFLEHVQLGEAGLVAHEVLAMPHDADAER